jgi:hypothetical protein
MFTTSSTILMSNPNITQKHDPAKLRPLTDLEGLEAASFQPKNFVPHLRFLDDFQPHQLALLRLFHIDAFNLQ